MPDETTYVSISKAITRSRGHHGRPPARVAIGLGCDQAYADSLVYFDRGNLSTSEPTLLRPADPDDPFGGFELLDGLPQVVGDEGDDAFVHDAG